MLLLLLACDETPKTETHTYTDQGDACLSAPTADAEGTVTVDPHLCLSGSCDELISSGCTATLEGTTITVTSEFVVESPAEPTTCTTDCGMPTASCTVGPLPAGTYDLVYGAATGTAVVPGDGDCAYAE